jgi:hypothetical protein
MSGIHASANPLICMKARQLKIFWLVYRVPRKPLKSIERPAGGFTAQSVGIAGF